MAAAAASVPVQQFAEYETIYILHPSTSTEESHRVAERIGEVMGRLEGKLVKVENWGKRKLAYPIAKSTRGVFVYLRFCAPHDLVAELERNLRLLEAVVRFQTVLLAKGVDPASLEVDPEEVKFIPVEVGEEDDQDEEEGLEERLGLATRKAAPEERRGDEEGESGSSSEPTASGEEEE